MIFRIHRLAGGIVEPGVLYTSLRGQRCPLRMHTLVGGGCPSKMSAFLGGSSTERRGGKSPDRHPVVIKLSSCGAADEGRFSDPPPDPGVPPGRRSCVDSGDGRGWGSAAGAPPGRGEQLTPSGADRRGSAAHSRVGDRTVGAGDPPRASLLAHPSSRIPSPARRGTVPPSRNAHRVQVRLPWPRTCRAERVGDPAAGVAGAGRRLPGLGIRTQRISSQSWTRRRSGRASLSRSAVSFSWGLAGGGPAEPASWPLTPLTSRTCDPRIPPTPGTCSAQLTVQPREQALCMPPSWPASRIPASSRSVSNIYWNPGVIVSNRK